MERQQKKKQYSGQSDIRTLLGRDCEVEKIMRFLKGIFIFTFRSFNIIELLNRFKKYLAGLKFTPYFLLYFFHREINLFKINKIGAKSLSKY